MITLFILLILYVIIGWSYRGFRSYYDEYYDFNPFEDVPNLFSITLVLSTLVLVGILIGLCLIYLP